VPPILARLTYGWLALFAAFMATAPWRIGNTVIRQVNLILALGVVLFAIAAISKNVRGYYAELLRADVTLSRRTRWMALAAASLFLLRLVWSKWLALEVNAWDFTINFDRPIRGLLHGSLLYSEEFGMSMLGNHATWLSFAFAPLYAIYETPVWLLLAHALGVAAGVAAAYAFVRHETGDDLIAFVLAASFLINRFVAKATQYVFHPEVFYPLGLFLLYLAYRRGKRGTFLVALLLLVALKEDAIIPIFGFALLAIRRWKWAASALAIGGAVFALDYFVVMPHYAQAAAGEVSYATYWGSFGATPLEAVGGMLRRPHVVVERVAVGATDMFLSMALLPLLGWEWLIAALPGLFIYGSSDMDKLHWFTLYYSMPVLPGVFAAILPAMRRIAHWLKRDERTVSRVCAVIVLLASIAIGTGHILYEPHPDKDRIVPLLQHVQNVPSTWIQGAIFPQVGYSRELHVFNERAQLDGKAAFLFSADLDPYFYDRSTIEKWIADLTRDPRYRRIDSGTLRLFVPRQTAGRT
jgi:uncharacterized membrane protein